MATSRSAAVIRVVAFSGAAALAYGGWAVWINAVHGPGAQLRAGLAQGFASAVATATITGIIEWLRVRLRDVRRGDGIAVAIAATAASLWHLSVNFVAGTPALLATAAPSMVMAWVFGGVYAAGLRRTEGELARTPPR